MKPKEAHNGNLLPSPGRSSGISYGHNRTEGELPPWRNRRKSLRDKSSFLVNFVRFNVSNPARFEHKFSGLLPLLLSQKSIFTPFPNTYDFKLFFKDKNISISLTSSSILEIFGVLNSILQGLLFQSYPSS